MLLNLRVYTTARQAGYKKSRDTAGMQSARQQLRSAEDMGFASSGIVLLVCHSKQQVNSALFALFFCFYLCP